MGWFEVLFYIGIIAIPTGAIFFVVWRNRGE
jgi:hypothetical protein